MQINLLKITSYFVKELEIPEWIEEKLIPESAKGREITVGIEESYQRIIPG